MEKLENNTEASLPGGDKSPFRVPEQYFEDLPGRIRERISHESRPTVRLLAPRLAYAAMIAVLVTVGYLALRNLTGIFPEEGLSADEAEYFIEYYAYEIDDDMLASALTEEEIEYYPEFSETETEALIEYLSEDYIDFSELINGN